MDCCRPAPTVSKPEGIVPASWPSLPATEPRHGCVSAEIPECSDRSSTSRSTHAIWMPPWLRMHRSKADRNEHRSRSNAGPWRQTKRQQKPEPSAMERPKPMPNAPIDLDRYRDSEARTTASQRRRRCLDSFRTDQASLERAQIAFEDDLMATPAQTWPLAAAKAQYLIQLFAATPQASDPRCRQFIEQTLDDLACLCASAEDYP